MLGVLLVGLLLAQPRYASNIAGLFRVPFSTSRSTVTPLSLVDHPTPVLKYDYDLGQLPIIVSKQVTEIQKSMKNSPSILRIQIKRDNAHLVLKQIGSPPNIHVYISDHRGPHQLKHGAELTVSSGTTIIVIESEGETIHCVFSFEILINDCPVNLAHLRELTTEALRSVQELTHALATIQDDGIFDFARSIGRARRFGSDVGSALGWYLARMELQDVLVLAEERIDSGAQDGSGLISLAATARREVNGVTSAFATADGSVKAVHLAPLMTELLMRDPDRFAPLAVNLDHVLTFETAKLKRLTHRLRGALKSGYRSCCLKA